MLQRFSSGRTPEQVITEFESYTGLTYADDNFTTAAATIGAQTGLSTFMCLASFALILFLAPPNRLFAAWTTPTGDRRPTVLVAVLVVVFAVVLFVPALWSYFGLTGPARVHHGVARARVVVGRAERGVPLPGAGPGAGAQRAAGLRRAVSAVAF